MAIQLLLSFLWFIGWRRVVWEYNLLSLYLIPSALIISILQCLSINHHHHFYLSKRNSFASQSKLDHLNLYSDHLFLWTLFFLFLFTIAWPSLKPIVGSTTLPLLHLGPSLALCPYFSHRLRCEFLMLKSWPLSDWTNNFLSTPQSRN